MTKESERKQVIADEKSATVREDARAALERKQDAADRQAATAPQGATPSLWQRIKRYFKEILKRREP